MGCALTAGHAVTLPRLRQRFETYRLRRQLSLERTDGSPGRTDSAGRSRLELLQDRRLLLHLGQQRLADFLQQGADKYGVCSETDEALHRATSFASKRVSSFGDALVRMPRDGLGFACKKGLKPEAPNQDSFLICRVDGQFSLYGVFDGHGRKGHEVADFVKDYLPKVLVTTDGFLDDPGGALEQAFAITQRLIESSTALRWIDAQRSGCTATVVVHMHRRNMIYAAHVGDSRCVLGQQSTGSPWTASSDGMWQAVDLTEDHKPNNPMERARIEQNGGQVRFDGAFNYRVYAKDKRYPGLNMSRAMGDLVGFHDAGISAVPDVAERFIENSAPRVPKERVVTLLLDEPAPASASPLARAVSDPRTRRTRTNTSLGSLEEEPRLALACDETAPASASPSSRGVASELRLGRSRTHSGAAVALSSCLTSPGMSPVTDPSERSVVFQEVIDVELAGDTTPEAAAMSPPAAERRLARMRTSSAASSAPSYVPSVSSHSIDPACDKILLLCSDGVWEFLSSEEAVQIVGRFGPNEAMAAAEQLAREAWERWMYHMQSEVVDDITVVVVYLDPGGDDRPGSPAGAPPTRSHSAL